MKTIYKYELPFNDEGTIKMPRDAEVLCVAEQHERIYVWALVNPKAEKLPVAFKLRGTGHDCNEQDFDFPRNVHYVGTMHNFRGLGHVIHVFRVIEQLP